MGVSWGVRLLHFATELVTSKLIYSVCLLFQIFWKYGEENVHEKYLEEIINLLTEDEDPAQIEHLVQE